MKEFMKCHEEPGRKESVKIGVNDASVRASGPMGLATAMSAILLAVPAAMEAN
jgi:hypothetical protein